jgi:hypothetical protein
MIEIDIPITTVNLLYNYVLTNLGDRVLGTFPFYTKVTDNLLQDAFCNIIDLSCVSTGYIYAHDETIPLHVDRYKNDSVYNLNVPIYVEDKNQKFIVFDQEFIRCGCEWQVEGVKQKRHRPLLDSDLVNSKKDNNHLESICYTGTRPYETDGIIGLTNNEVNSDIIQSLFNYGASPYINSNDGSTPLHPIIKNYNWRINDILKNGLSGKDRAKRIFSYESGNNNLYVFVN